jgi:hypothetical protein
LRNSNLQRGVAALTKTGKEENDNYCFRVSTNECSTYRKKLLINAPSSPSVRPYVGYMFCLLKSFQTRTFFFYKFPIGFRNCSEVYRLDFEIVLKFILLLVIFLGEKLKKIKILTIRTLMVYVKISLENNQISSKLVNIQLLREYTKGWHHQILFIC